MTNLTPGHTMPTQPSVTDESSTTDLDQMRLDAALRRLREAEQSMAEWRQQQKAGTACAGRFFDLSREINSARVQLAIARNPKKARKLGFLSDAIRTARS